MTDPSCVDEVTLAPNVMALTTETATAWEPVIAGRDTVAGPGWALPRHLDDPRVRAALATERGRAIAGFARFLVAEVDSSGTGVTVYLRDARYARTSRGGWAVVPVRLSGE